MRSLQRLCPLVLAATLALVLRGCATIRVTDPPSSATEQFLQSEATRRAGYTPAGPRPEG